MTLGNSIVSWPSYVNPFVVHTWVCRYDQGEESFIHTNTKGFLSLRLCTWHGHKQLGEAQAMWSLHWGKTHVAFLLKPTNMHNNLSWLLHGFSCTIPSPNWHPNLPNGCPQLAQPILGHVLFFFLFLSHMLNNTTKTCICLSLEVDWVGLHNLSCLYTYIIYEATYLILTTKKCNPN